MIAPTYAQLAPEYRAQFALAVPQPGTRGQAEAARICAHMDRYAALAARIETAVPWFAVGLIHIMEADGNFDCHLHNGDPLSRRTVHEPAGRPVQGQPPFTWEESALDALRQARWHTVAPEEWDLAGLLYRLEAYNGWGPRLLHDRRTAYLWAGSSLEQPGKYIADGQWSPTATSAQAGAAVILKQLVTTGRAVFRAQAAQAAAAITA